MKKTLLFLSLTTSVLVGFSQITVTHTDVVGVGESVVQSYDSLPGTAITVGGTGANQVWDYSTLNNHESDTINFISPNWTPFAADFPNANIAMENSSEDSTWSFLEKTPTELNILGFAEIDGGTPFIMHIDRTFLEFPLNYQNSYTSVTDFDTAIYIGQPGVDSVRYKNTETILNTVDAWGDVTTPNGTFPCLRINQTTYGADSTWAYLFGTWQLQDADMDTSISYMFWTNDPAGRFPIAELNIEDDLITVSDVSYLSVSPFAAINEIKAPVINVFPNPSSQQINLNLDQAGLYINIYDVKGTRVKSIRNQSNLTGVDISGLENGTYLVLVRDENGKTVAKSKFMKI